MMFPRIDRNPLLCHQNEIYKTPAPKIPVVLLESSFRCKCPRIEDCDRAIAAECGRPEETRLNRPSGSVEGREVAAAGLSGASARQEIAAYGRQRGFAQVQPVAQILVE